jgi:phage-related protein
MANDIVLTLGIDDNSAKSELKSFVSKAESTTIEIDTSVKKPDFGKVTAEAEKAGKDAGDGFSSGFSGAAKAGLVVGGVLAAVAGIKAAFDFTKETNAMRKQVATFSGAAGQDLTNLTAKVQATAKTFDKDFNETLQSTNAIAKGFGISMEEAGDVMNKAFLSGADATDELLAVTREYPILLAEVGLNAEQAMAVLTQQVTGGVFSDKGIDVIKEAGLRLREMTAPTKDAIDAIGLSSDAIMAGISDGSLTAFEAMQQVSDKLKDTELTSVQVGTAIADIFGGPGEDAGLKYLQSLSDMNLNLDDLVDKNAEFNGQQLSMLQIQEKLSVALQGIAGALSPVFNEILKLFSDVLLPILTDVIKNVFPIFAKLAQTVGDILGEVISSIMPVVSRILEGLTPLIDTVLGAIEQLIPSFMELLEPILDIVDVLLKEFLPVLTEIFESVMPMVIASMKVTITMFTVLLNAIKPVIIWLIELGSTIVKNVMPIFTSFTETLTDIYDGISNLITGVAEFFGIIDKESPVIQENITNFDELGEAASTTGAKVKEDLTPPVVEFGEKATITGTATKTLAEQLTAVTNSIAKMILDGNASGATFDNMILKGAALTTQMDAQKAATKGATDAIAELIATQANALIVPIEPVIDTSQQDIRDKFIESIESEDPVELPLSIIPISEDKEGGLFSGIFDNLKEGLPLIDELSTVIDNVFNGMSDGSDHS